MQVTFQADEKRHSYRVLPLGRMDQLVACIHCVALSVINFITATMEVL